MDLDVIIIILIVKYWEVKIVMKLKQMVTNNITFVYIMLQIALET